MSGVPQVMIDAAVLAGSDLSQDDGSTDGHYRRIVEAALAAAPTEPVAWRRVVIDRLLPESGDERDALVEVMQDAIFESFDIDSGAREFAFAAYEALRDALTTEGEMPANTTEEQG